MSIAALKEWGGDLTNMLSDAIIDDLQNASLITLTITTDGIAKSMHRTLSSPMIKVRGTIPTEKQIANAVKKTFNDNGTLDPNKDNTPKENAMSVAEGIAQPFKVFGSLKFITT